jgi:hypothetical protein
MEITRKWAMPNKRTFTIKPIREIICRYKKEGLWLDPFPFPYKEDALKYLSTFEDNCADGVLFDPPYSPRQLKECYDSQGMVLHDTKSSVWANWKDKIASVIKQGGLCLSFGWSSQGLGKNRGFEIIEIMLVAHGGNHNDTIVVVERKKLIAKSKTQGATPSFNKDLEVSASPTPKFFPTEKTFLNVKLNSITRK